MISENEFFPANLVLETISAQLHTTREAAVSLQKPLRSRFMSLWSKSSQYRHLTRDGETILCRRICDQDHSVQSYRTPYTFKQFVVRASGDVETLHGGVKKTRCTPSHSLRLRITLMPRHEAHCATTYDPNKSLRRSAHLFRAPVSLSKKKSKTVPTPGILPPPNSPITASHHE